MKKSILSRTVIFLSIISFFADISSELLYPVLPLYLKSIGMGAVFIGILEGAAEAMAGLSKTYFGKLSDRSGRRMPFVWTGYVLSSFSKAAIGFIVNPLWVLMMRTSDRLGKGIRTAARDAILSDEATPETKGAVFGFHRAMDTFGAFMGPILALVYLHYHPKQYRDLFIYALVPAIFVVIALSMVKEKKHAGKKEDGNIFWNSILYWKIASDDYKKIISLVLLFTLMNSSDMFLLLRVKEITGSDFSSILIYIFYNFIYALTSYQVGILSDKYGKKSIFLWGLFFFAITYAGMAFATEMWHFFVLFFIYALFGSCNEGIVKAWVSNLCKREDLATAIGFQATTQSLASMGASLLAGIIWYLLGAKYVFLMSAIVTITLIYFFRRLRNIAS